jgi:hypothetical protein
MYFEVMTNLLIHLFLLQLAVGVVVYWCCVGAAVVLMLLNITWIVFRSRTSLFLWAALC